MNLLPAPISLTLEGRMSSNTHMGPHHLSSARVSVPFAGTSPVTPAIGVLAVRRREHVLAMVGLGSAARTTHPKAPVTSRGRHRETQDQWQSPACHRLVVGSANPGTRYAIGRQLNPLRARHAYMVWNT